MKAVLSLAPLLAACAALPPPGSPVTGEWGGMHVGLTLGASGGRIEYDCAGGTIGPVVPEGDGRFVADGTHTPEHGGPVREGEVLPTYKARFKGRIQGERMILAGRTETGVALGPFELRRGAAPTLLRCL